MKIVRNKVYKYICPKVKTCRNNHIDASTRGICVHCVPHDKLAKCKAGRCGVEDTAACEEVCYEEN